MTHVPDEPEDAFSPDLSPELLAQLDGPPEAWLAELTHEALPDVVVPREAMWSAIQQRRMAERVQPVNGPQEAASLDALSDDITARRHARHEGRRWFASPALIGLAATLLAGVAIGRYAIPHTSSSATVANRDGSPTRTTSALAPSESLANASGASSGANAQTNVSAALLNVALSEHLLRSEALLTTVRYDNPDAKGTPDLTIWARELLGTTHLLLDDPSMRDVKTRQLLEDLELVLVQVVQARSSKAPLVRHAPAETLRETNLLPRVRAASSASPQRVSNSNSRGIAE